MPHNAFDFHADEYDQWFADNPQLFESELRALKQLLPQGKKTLEVGIGSGIFAEQLGITDGIDPSEGMLTLARQRNLNVRKGVAEHLPYADASYDTVVFITSICFVEDPVIAMQEAFRVLKVGGALVLAFLDRQHAFIATVEAGKQESTFFRDAQFYSVGEVLVLIEQQGFRVTDIVQTLTNPSAPAPEDPIEGYGQGAFVVVRAEKLYTTAP